jgi:5-methylcytosine-specific restriction enzyme A
VSWKPYKPCPYPGCPAKIPAEAKHCDEHKRMISKEYEASRGSSYARGYRKRWDLVAKAHLMKYPECVKCGRPAEEVDHIKPHKGDQRLFWDAKNMQSLCKVCHSRKTAEEDGRWGAKVKGQGSEVNEQF